MPKISEDEFDLAMSRYLSFYPERRDGDWREFLGGRWSYIPILLQNGMGAYLGATFEVSVSEFGARRIKLLNTDNWRTILKAMEVCNE